MIKITVCWNNRIWMSTLGVEVDLQYILPCLMCTDFLTLKNLNFETQFIIFSISDLTG